MKINKQCLLNKSPNILIIHMVGILFISQLSSCSWLSSRKTMFDEDDKKAVVKKDPKSVSRQEYNSLLTKYENLLKSIDSTQVQSTPVKKAQAPMTKSDNSELVETVDIFAQKESTAQVPKVVSSVRSNDPKNVSNELSYLRSAETYISQNNFDKALLSIKEIENSSNRQIQVRAKFMLGELLFVQKEYDLAMQVYEEIITKFAFSGIVIKTLGRLVVCSEKLNLKEKKDQYYSILHDFFEAA